MRDPKDARLYLCRASGEGSHSFRIAADEAGVMKFYEEMFGPDSEGKMDSALEHFRDGDNWSNDREAYSVALYCAHFEVWKIHPSELGEPGAKTGRLMELEGTRANADYWVREAEKLNVGDAEKFLCMEQAVNAWKNAAYWNAGKLAELRAVVAAPVDMILYCPRCGLQHVDAPAEGWTNPPHRSHLCAGCGTTWRPADVPTNGVLKIETRGKRDTWYQGEMARTAQEVPQLDVSDPRPCVHPIGMTTCGYPQASNIHEGGGGKTPPDGRHVYTPPPE